MVLNEFRLCVPNRHNYAFTLTSAAEKSLNRSRFLALSRGRLEKKFITKTR